MSTESSSQAFSPHDHSRCRTVALQDVAAICKSRSLRLTPVRRCVLEALLQEHRALTAYELLDHLRRADFGSQPPVVYRALEFLVTNGFVHRIEKLSAFVACTHMSADHAAAFLVCRDCRRVAETEFAVLDGHVSAVADSHAFQVEWIVMEVEGLCRNCQGGQQ